jgi:hypothetical protein
MISANHRLPDDYYFAKAILIVGAQLNKRLTRDLGSIAVSFDNYTSSAKFYTD